MSDPQDPAQETSAEVDEKVSETPSGDTPNADVSTADVSSTGVSSGDASITEAAVQDVLSGDDGGQSPPPVTESPAAAPAPPPAKASSKPAVEVDDDVAPMDWYILKVAFNREDGIADTLRKRVKMEGMEEHFKDIVVPTEDVKNFTRDGKPRITKQKLYPGYIMVHMRINDDTWFLVRETAGISDFTGASGKPMPMDPEDVARILTKPRGRGRRRRSADEDWYSVQSRRPRPRQRRQLRKSRGRCRQRR